LGGSCGDERFTSASILFGGLLLICQLFHEVLTPTTGVFPNTRRQQETPYRNASPGVGRRECLQPRAKLQVRRCPVRFQRGFAPVNLEEVIDILVLLVSQYVEAKATWLIPFGAQSIRLDRLEKGSRSSALTRTFTHIASMCSSCLGIA
jgi:hypothetical protein